MVSGRYFFPKAPVLCLKWMPALAVTSVNSMGPERRAEPVPGTGAGGGAGAGWADGAAEAGDFAEGVSDEDERGCLQLAKQRSAASARQHEMRLRSIRVSRSSSPTVNFTEGDYVHDQGTASLGAVLARRTVLVQQAVLPRQTVPAQQVVLA